MPFALAVSQPGQSRPPPNCHLPHAHRAAATGDSNGTCSFKWGKDTDLHELNSHATAVSILIAESNAVVYCRKVSSLPHVPGSTTQESHGLLSPCMSKPYLQGTALTTYLSRRVRAHFSQVKGEKTKNPMPCLRYNFSPDDKSKFYPFFLPFGQNTLLSS